MTRKICTSVMAFEPAIAICDACVLYPFHLRNILVQVSVDGLYEARWTDAIHDEWMRNLLANNPAIPPDRLQHTRLLMEAALPGARVTGFQHHIGSITLPDPDDRHVVAAGIEARASHILTWNLRDFPAAVLERHGLICQTPDSFLTTLYDQAPRLVTASLANARRNLSKSGISAEGFRAMLREQKLLQFEGRLQARTGEP